MTKRKLSTKHLFLPKGIFSLITIFFFINSYTFAENKQENTSFIKYKNILMPLNEKSNDNTLTLGAATVITLYSDTAMGTSISSSGHLAGGSIFIIKNLRSSLLLNMGLSIESLLSLSTQEFEIDLTNYSQYFYTLSTHIFKPLPLSSVVFGIGTGFDLFIGGTKYLKNMREENSSFADLLLSMGCFIQYPIDSINLFGKWMFSLNLTPGYQNFVGINNLLSIQNKFLTGITYSY
ncbi:MAG: hypothetical protein OEZ22_06100 [Spirochaetia bacterium]|nr:hypothetical protein [Spirochaetia bacterium]